MLDAQGRVGQLVAEISGEPEDLSPLLQILAHPASHVISDAEDYGRGAPHPAHAGAFARAFRLNREHGLMSLQALVRRMTGSPAERLGLTDRGRLEVEAFADIVVLDPAAITDRADWASPREIADGVEALLVNGVPIDFAAAAPPASGHLLRAGRDPAAASRE